MLKRQSSAIQGRLKAAVQTMFRTGRTAEYILDYLHKTNDDLRNLTLKDVEKLKVLREVNLIFGKPVARLPLPAGFKKKVRELIAEHGKEKALEILHLEKYTELLPEDISYIRPQNVKKGSCLEC